MTQKSATLAIVGAGAWGTTLALVADRANTPTTLVCRGDSALHSLGILRQHPVSLPGIAIPDSIRVTGDIHQSVAEADVVLFTVPTQKLRAAVAPLGAVLRGKTVVAASKGIEIGTSLLPTQILEDVIGVHEDTPLAGLSGPNLALEIARSQPATTVIASTSIAAANHVRHMLMSEAFRVYTATDVIGVQYGGALKNIIAIGAGISDGLLAGDNAKAAFLTRGIAEIARLGVHFGADPMTFAGLTGIGDLICTCSSNLSRNHRVGMGIAQGLSVDEVLTSMSETAEGVSTTRAVVELARAHGISMPIAEEMHRVLFENKTAVDAVRDLMMREPREEGI